MKEKGANSVLLEVDGVRLFALEAGQGEPSLVFIHANGGSHASWHQQIAYFSSRTKVVALDLRGHGDSGRDPARRYSHDTMVGDIYHCLQALQIRSAVLVGWSVGGALAVEFVAKHPELAAGVVLVDHNLTGADIGRGPRILKDTLAALEEDFDGTGVKLYVDFWFPETGPEIDVLREWCYDVCRRTTKEVIFAIRSQPAPENQLEPYRNLTVPTLVLQGGASPLGGRPMGEYLARLIPNSRLHVFEGKGHAHFLTAPDEFNQVLGAFLTEISARAR